MMALGSLFIWRDGGVVVGLVAAELLKRSLSAGGSYLVLAAVLLGFAMVAWQLRDGESGARACPVGSGSSSGQGA